MRGMRGHSLSGTVIWYGNFWSRSHMKDEKTLLAGRLIFLPICVRLVGPEDIDASLTRRKRD